ncbi:MAG: hypothetical protein AAF830_10830 [Pseudomonadota bacterium]
MKLQSLIASVASIGLAALGIANANKIVLSGDTNIAGGLPGGEQVDAGSQQFFLNVLGAGANVAVQDTTAQSVTDDAELINDFYSSQAGVTSTLLSNMAVLDATVLSGLDLFVSLVPDDDYSAAELNALSNFVSGGGVLFLLADNNNFPTQNGRINTLLASLGSSMSVVPNTVFDFGFQTATGGQIGVGALTAGVSSFTYAAPSELAVGMGAEQLLFGTGGQLFMASEGFVSGPEVPLPAAPLLFASGFAALYASRKRKD